LTADIRTTNEGNPEKKKEGRGGGIAWGREKREGNQMRRSCNQFGVAGLGLRQSQKSGQREESGATRNISRLKGKGRREKLAGERGKK